MCINNIIYNYIYFAYGFDLLLHVLDFKNVYILIVIFIEIT